MQCASTVNSDIHFLAPTSARPLARRSMLFSAVAGLSVAAMGVAAVAETTITQTLDAPVQTLAPTVSVAAPAKPAAPWPVPTQADRAEWAAFKAQVLDIDGRIVDTGNHGVSHSEGQGVGLLFAVAFDDPAAFDQILAWTQRHLLRSDGLHAWRWMPNTPVAVPDTNNATDGDIYIAGALQRAARRWGRPEHAAAARRTARTIHETLLQQVGDRLVLLPGREGFVHGGRVVVNLSYYVFPLLTELAAAYPSDRWAKLQRDGVALIQAGRFGRWSLPPDWLEIHSSDGSLAPAPSFPERFSYDAVRVPLFLAWSGLAPEVVQAAATFWRQSPQHPPAWVDLKTGMTAEYGAPPGVQAIATLAGSSRAKWHARPLPMTVAHDTYYSASLTLLSRLALTEAV
jgi:endo-1,4-beta-D-glucanase Y